MIRKYTDVLVSIIAVIGLVLAPIMYFLGSSTVKGTTSSEVQTSSTTPSILPVQNGNTQNYFIIDKSQFKKVPEFTGITGLVNTPASIKLADMKGKVVLVHFWT